MATVEPPADGDGGKPSSNGEPPAADPAESARQERDEKRRAPPPAASQTREEALVALLVWFTMGIALWHFTVFLPERFWQGIVGAFLGATLGAVIFGGIVEIISGKGLGDTDVTTALTGDSRAWRSAWRSSARSACARERLAD